MLVVLKGPDLVLRCPVPLVHLIISLGVTESISVIARWVLTSPWNCGIIPGQALVRSALSPWSEHHHWSLRSLRLISPLLLKWSWVPSIHESEGFFLICFLFRIWALSLPSMLQSMSVQTIRVMLFFDCCKYGLPCWYTSCSYTSVWQVSRCYAPSSRGSVPFSGIAPTSDSSKITSWTAHYFACDGYIHQVSRVPV